MSDLSGVMQILVMPCCQVVLTQCQPYAGNGVWGGAAVLWEGVEVGRSFVGGVVAGAKQGGWSRGGVGKEEFGNGWLDEVEEGRCFVGWVLWEELGQAGGTTVWRRTFVCLAVKANFY